jgi:hypothetical protein
MPDSNSLYCDQSGPYDGSAAEVDLWFLPALDEAETAAPTAELLPFAEWSAAQEALATDLAALCFDMGRLTERSTGLGEAAPQRLAQAEAVALSWWLGERISADRLALWLGNRIGALGEDAGGLTRIAWAARRLAAPAPAQPSIAMHLGFAPETAAAQTAKDATAALAAVSSLHAVTYSCAAFHLWRSLVERPDPLRDIEAAVLAARLGTGTATGFLPQSLISFAGLTASGSPKRRLAAWIFASHQAVRDALMQLERLADWQTRARAQTQDLSGRTPPALITAVMRHPMITAPQAQAETASSRAAVQRNLAELTTRGLLREVTGQGRFRVWVVRF